MLSLNREDVMTVMPLDQLTDEEGRLAALNRYCILDTAPERAFDKVAALAKATLNVPVSAVSLIARDRQWFKAIQGLETRQINRKLAFCDHTIRTRDAFVVEDAARDERFLANPLVTGDPHIRSYAGVPLRTPEGFNLGALCVMDFKPRTFRSDQIDVLAQLGSVIVRELEERSATLLDPLTACLSRQGLLDALQRRVDASRDTGDRSSLTLIDVDHFRRFNVMHGCPLGDQVLRRVAECCMTALRSGDIFGRLRNDIFAVILPGSGSYEALACSERLRDRVSRLTYPGTDARVTVTCGMAELQRGDGQQLWLAEAEGALFAAKSTGRNQCLSADKLR